MKNSKGLNKIPLRLIKLKKLNQNKKIMKKSVLALAMAFGVTTAFAQDLTSKKGEPILPEAGDWGLSVTANPFLTYAQGIFGKSGNTANPTFDFLNGTNNTNLIMGKYFKDEKTAYRVGINIGYASHSATNLVNQDNYVPTATAPLSMVTDKTSVKTTGFGLTGGMEMRRGKTRLQGYYGAELGLYFGSTHQKSTYGNAYASSGAVGTSTTPTSTSWTLSGGVPTSGGAAGAASRTTDWKSGSNIQFGVRGFIGTEYFLLPKMSLGGEFGWGIGYQVMTKDKATWDAEGTATGSTTQTPGEIKTKDAVSNGSSFVIDTDRNAINAANYNLMGGSGTIRLNFHF